MLEPPFEPTHPTALLVETEISRELLPLGDLIELSEPLPILPLPDASAIISGAITHRDVSLPVIHLDALLGRPSTKDDKHGAFAIVEIDGRQCALAVKRVVGLAVETDSNRVIDLRSLLADLLHEAGAVRATTGSKERNRVTEKARYLLAEVASQTCGFEVASVAHLHAECRILRAPKTDESLAVGVTAIGGRVLPVLDLAGHLGLQGKLATPQFIELNLRQSETFVVAVERIVGIVAIRQDMLSEPPEDRPISAVAQLGSKAVWILTPSLIARREARGPDAV